MAVIGKIELDNGIVIEDAYHVIDTVSGGKDNLEILVLSYLDEKAYAGGKSPVVGRTFSFVPDLDEGSENFLKQGYEFLLKSQTGFQSSK